MPDQIREVQIDPVGLPGILGVPSDPSGIVLFAHGSGSSRLSPRNTQVAAALREMGFATLQFDLLFPEEEKDRHAVFNIPLLSERLTLATAWVRLQPDLADLPLGYFGASTGAAAALVAASSADLGVQAIVSRGGRPDLARDALELVTAPTLLIVGGLDGPVIGLNQDALARLSAPKRLVIVPGAGHLFEEPGTLEEVIRHAAGWFSNTLRLKSEEARR